MKNKKLVSFLLLFIYLLNGCTTEKANKLSAEDANLLRAIKDEVEIRALADRFSDAANRMDGAAFQELWAKQAVWKIGAPINMEFKVMY